jgi:hypothetical protein
MLRPVDRLAARLELLSAPRDPEYMSPGFIDKLPPEGNNPKHEYLVRCSYFVCCCSFIGGVQLSGRLVDVRCKQSLPSMEETVGSQGN